MRKASVGIDPDPERADLALYWALLTQIWWRYTVIAWAISEPVDDHEESPPPELPQTDWPEPVKSIADIVTVVRDPDPSENKRAFLTATAERLIGEVTKEYQDGSWDGSEVEGDVHDTLEALKKELWPRADRDFSAVVVEAYSTRLDEYLIALSPPGLEELANTLSEVNAGLESLAEGAQAGPSAEEVFDKFSEALELLPPAEALPDESVEEKELRIAARNDPKGALAYALDLVTDPTTSFGMAVRTVEHRWATADKHQVGVVGEASLKGAVGGAGVAKLLLGASAAGSLTLAVVGMIFAILKTMYKPKDKE